MGVCTFFDKSMKVLSSILAMATAQWDGFNYDDYSDVGKNQASQVSVNDVLNMNGASGQTAANYAANNHYLGNGLKCFYCNERSVSACFTRSTFSVCQGQEYFCFFHERRKISHFSTDVKSTLITLHPETLMFSWPDLPMKLSTWHQLALLLPIVMLHRLLFTLWLVVSNHRLVFVNNLRIIQLQLVLNSMVVVAIQFNKMETPSLLPDVMFVKVFAVWAKTGPITVVITGTMITMVKLQTAHQTPVLTS